MSLIYRSGGYSSRLLSGKMGLSVRHILLICSAIGMEPAEFFHLAYPEAPSAGESSGMARDILRRFQGLGYEGKGAGRAASPAPPPSPALSDAELDERIRASLSRALRELVSGETAAAAPASAGSAPKRSTRGRK